MKNILVAVDMSDGCTNVFNKGAELARAFSGKLWAMHVVPAGPGKYGDGTYIQNERDSGLPRKDAAELLREKHRKIQGMVQTVRKDGLNAQALLVKGSVMEKILNEAEIVNADMIVLGSHCHGSMFHHLFCNVCNGVMQKSIRPVLVIHTPDQNDPDDQGEKK
jgi:nucleotide-binding universal stress UspA family protein